MDNNKPKKEWKTPVLEVYGEVVKLTTDVKLLGGSDGVILCPPNPLTQQWGSA